MAFHETMIPMHLGTDKLMDWLREEFRDLKGFEIVHSPQYPNPVLRYETRDHGIWEWNEEIISASPAEGPGASTSETAKME